MGRTSRTSLIALVAATLLGGCGGGDGAAQGETDVPPAQVEAIEEAGQQATDFCAAALANVEAGQALKDFSLAAPAPRPQEEMEAVLGPVRESNAQLLASAPEMAKADMEQVNEVTELRLAAFEASGGDPAAADADPAIAEKLAAVAKPSARITQYIRTTCRIDPS